MDIAKAMRFGAMAVFAATVLGLSAGCAAPSLTAKTKEMTHVDNAPFYVDGKFDAEKGKQAYFELMEKLGAPVYARYKDEPGFLWAVDFAQGDFARFGMGGVFW